MGAGCSCSDIRAVSAVTIANGPPDGAEAEDILEDGRGGGGGGGGEGRSLRDGLQDEDGVFHGEDGSPSSTSLANFILQALRLHAAGNSVAQVDAETQEVWSYKTLLTHSVQMATALMEDGLGPGDTVAFFSRNHHELFPAVLGCLLAGVTAATMVPTHGARELRHQLSLCKPKMIVVEASLLERTEEALQGFTSEVRIVSLQPEHQVTNYHALLERGAAADPDTFSAPEIPDRHSHAVFILYSSGTTGLPKGVQIPNAGMTTMLENISPVPDSKEQGLCTILALAPISWISGVILLLKGIEQGHRRVFITDPKPRQVLSCLQKYKVDVWPTAPSVLLALTQHAALRLFNFSSVKTIISGGGPLDAQLQAEIERKLRCAVVQGYGSTECGLLLKTTATNNKMGAMGLPESLVSIRLVDLDTNEVVREPGRVGEMRVRSPCTMIGYIGNPEATAECYDEEGWFRTGDLASFDEDGFFFYVDRLKEMIKYKAHQVAPSEVESVMLCHPGVKDVCVMGLPHPIDGEHPMAFVVKNKRHVDPQDLQNYVAEQLSDPKRLRGGIVFLDSVPRTLTGKIMRGKLKTMLPSLQAAEE